MTDREKFHIVEEQIALDPDGRIGQNTLKKQIAL
jgi:hypothetical protein